MAYTPFRFHLIPLLWLRIKKIEGLENLPQDKSFIVAANHSSWLDGPFLVAALFYKIKKKIYFFSRFRIWFWLGVLTINKKNKGKTLEKALNYVKRGRIFCFFPEGTTNPTKTLLPGKTGVARLALWSKLPVIPIGINGTEIKGRIKAFFYLWFFWRKIIIKIGQPFEFDQFFGQDISRETLHKITDKIMREIAVLCGKKIAESNFN